MTAAPTRLYVNLACQVPLQSDKVQHKDDELRILLSIVSMLGMLGNN